MGNGIFISILYHPIWRTDMQEMRQNIDKENNSRLMECLKICLESLDWIKDNSSINNLNRMRAKKTLKEIKKILKK